MSFIPKYTISNQLVNNIARIHALAADMNARRFPNVVLLEFERTARAVSAHASTSIEGNPLPLTEVKKLLKTQPSSIRDSEKEVLNYNAALEMLNKRHLEGSADVTLDLILDIQRQVVSGGLLPKNEAGALRNEPVVVNDPRSGNVVYMPPDHQDVRGLIDDLLAFIHKNKDEIDPLLLAGIFHKQFVLIHPFTDGNGRTTRLTTKVLLAGMGLNTFNLFSFENYYNQNVTKYFQTVGEFGDWYEKQEEGIDFTNWLEYFTGGIIDELLRVQDLLPRSTTPATALQPHHEIILNIIKEKGYVADKDYAERTDRSRASRILDFQKLLELGIIERHGQAKATYYTLSGEGENGN